MAQINPLYPITELTQAQYDALGVKDANTLYAIPLDGVSPSHQRPAPESTLPCVLIAQADYDALGTYDGNTLYCIGHPEPSYDETKIAILPLDIETLQPTGTIYYFGNFQDAKSWLYDRPGSGGLFHVRIGSEMGIDSIPDTALNGCINIFRLTIPEGIETIGVRAFAACSALSALQMPYSMLTVSERAFYQCVGLTEVYLSRNLRSIGFESFARCQSLKSIVIPSNVETVGSGAFLSCTSLDTIVIENGVQFIKSSAFSGCNATSIEVPKSITEIRSNAFNTTSIRNITIDKPQDSISGAPWGATNATVVWTG